VHTSKMEKKNPNPQEHPSQMIFPYYLHLII